MCILSDCDKKGKKIYGDFCYKHRRNYLIDKNSNKIIIERWTNKSSDYLKKDFIDNLCNNWYLYDLDADDLGNKSKQELFLLLVNKINSLKKYNEKDIQRIIQFQKRVKSKKNKSLDKLRGKGFLDKELSNNECDFFTYESRNEIEDKYYFSYEDEKGFIWFFDIRSFNKLIEMQQPNPYTMIGIPETIIQIANKLTTLLNLTQSDELVDQKQQLITRKQMIKQKTIDLFSDIDNSGYYCQPIWFLCLNLQLLKKLYRNLEDLWNYRLQITNEVKSRICPPNGLVFTTRVSDVNNITSREDIRDLILNDIIKFQNAVSLEDKKLGYIYFIIGLGSISKECWETHNWLMNV